MSTPVDINVPPLPAGFCLSASAIQNHLKTITAVLPGDFTVWNVGPNEPTIENRSKPWHKTDPSTFIGMGDFDYSPTFGAWLKRHWNANQAPFNERRMFIGSLTDLETYDGGEPGTVSDTTGPFWEKDANFDNKWPLGVGALIVTVNTDLQVFDDATPGPPSARGVYFIKPTGRLYDRSS